MEPQDESLALSPPTLTLSGWAQQRWLIMSQGSRGWEIINLAASILELARVPPILSSYPPLDLVFPHLENLCFYFSRDFVSYISYRDVGGLSLDHISWRLAI